LPESAILGAHALLSDPSSLVLEFTARGKPAFVLSSPATPGAVIDDKGHALPVVETREELRTFLDQMMTSSPTRTHDSVQTQAAGERIRGHLLALVHRDSRQPGTFRTEPKFSEIHSSELTHA